MKKFLLAVLCVAGSWGWAGPQETTGETVVVTASRLGVVFGKTPAKVSIISQEEIKSSGAQSLSELISKKLPFYVKESPGLTGTLWMGGMKSDDAAPSLFSRVLILVNGHPAGSGNLDRLPFSAVERIEVLEGPASALYGSGALNGVVNIITRKKNTQREIQAKVSWGSFDFQKAEFSTDFAVPDSFYGVFEGGMESRGDYETAQGKTYQNTGYEKNQAYAGFLVPLTAGMIEGSFSYLQGRKIGNPNTLASNDLDDYSETDHINLDTQWRQFWQGGEFQALGYFTSDDALNVGKGPGLYDNWKLDQKLAESGLSLMVRQNLGRWEIRAGASGDYAKLSKQSETGNYNEPKTSSFVLGFFSELQWEVLSGLTFSLGGRYDAYFLRMEDSAGITFNGGKKDKNLDFISARMGAAFQKDFWIIKISGGNGFTVPNLLQLAGNYTGPWGDYEGNPNLDPEKSLAFQMSGGISAQHSLIMSYEIQKIESRITTTPYTFGVPTTYVNQKEAVLESLGLEGKLNWGEWVSSTFTGWLTARGIYYLRYQDKEKNQNLPYVPELKTTLTLTTGIKDLVQVSLDGVYTGVFTDGFTSKKLGKTFSLDAGIHLTPFDFWLQDSLFNGLSMNFQVKNLTNENLVWVDGYPMPGRSFEAGFAYRYPF